VCIRICNFPKKPIVFLGYTKETADLNAEVTRRYGWRNCWDIDPGIPCPPELGDGSVVEIRSCARGQDYKKLADKMADLGTGLVCLNSILRD
jgi:hypothetical protein